MRNARPIGQFDTFEEAAEYAFAMVLKPGNAQGEKDGATHVLNAKGEVLVSYGVPMKVRRQPGGWYCEWTPGAWTRVEDAVTLQDIEARFPDKLIQDVTA